MTRCEPSGWGRPRIRALLPWLLSVGLVLACRTPSAIPLPPDPLEPFLVRAHEARGRAFLRPVGAFLVPPSKVGPRLEAEMRRLVDSSVFDAQMALLKAVGVVALEADPWQELLELQGDSVAGYYAALDDRLYVVAPDPEAWALSLEDPALAQILVHELGHALQAQHTRLMEVGLGLQQPDDLAFALSGLLEGDALFTELTDHASAGGSPRPGAGAYAERFDKDVRFGLPEVSPWLATMFLGPYPAGYAWVIDRFETEGRAGLDRAWQDPPLSSAALLDPSRVRPGRHELAAPGFQPLGCRRLATNAYGAVGLGLWLDLSQVERMELPWHADRAWSLACADRTDRTDQIDRTDHTDHTDQIDRTDQTDQVDQTGWAWLVEAASPEAADAWADRFEGRASRTAPPARVDRSAARILVSVALPEAARHALLEESRTVWYPDLEAWLLAHPAVLERSRKLRTSP